MPVFPPQSKQRSNELDLHQQAILPFWNEEDFARKTLINKTSLLNLFRQLDIPYVMGDYCTDLTVFENPNFLKQFSVVKNIVADDTFNIGQLHSLTRDLSKTPCGHDGIEGQKAVADYILAKIKELMPDATFNRIEKDKYLTLQNYKNPKSKKNLHWV